MKRENVAYIAGVVDATGLFRVKVEKAEGMNTGYQIRVSFRIHWSDPQTVVIGMLDEYCEEYFVKYQINEYTTTQFEVQKPDHIRRFMEPLTPYIVQQVDQMQIFMGEILPAIEEGQHHTKEGFVELMETIDEMYEVGKAPRNRKYDAAYFKQAWSGELAG